METASRACSTVEFKLTVLLLVAVVVFRVKISSFSS